MIIIFNPVAGRRRAQALWRVLDILSSNGVRIELVETQCVGHAEKLARTAVQAGASLVVAAGGDGTIAEVANGLMGSPAKLGVIPIGTANVLAHELGLPFVPTRIAAALAFGRTRALRPGIASGATGQRLFVQMLGVGFDGFVVRTMPLPLKRVLGRGAYVLHTMACLRRHDFRPLTLRVDGQETQTGSAIVSKGRFYGGAYQLARDAVPADPGFSVSLFDRNGPMAALMYAAALPLGLLANAPGVRQMRAFDIAFITNEPIAAQADGDYLGTTPLRITDAPASIQVIVD